MRYNNQENKKARKQESKKAIPSTISGQGKQESKKTIPSTSSGQGKQENKKARKQ